MSLSGSLVRRAVFFISSRRRHTRLVSDWSSDVCSSDLDFFLYGLKQLGAEIDIDDGYVVARAPKGGLVGGRVHLPKVSVGATHTIMMAASLRSEERRVGKECRSRWSPYH